MPGSIGSDRFVRSGENTAGDPVYVRSYGSPAVTTYADMTKDELSAELERRGLPKSGNKDELVARLEESD